ncbi:MAG: HYR domain-containing protein [Chitinophagales bacterium]|nr:HYR domain-containing protein [Chitinophagales bacterium]
MKNRAFNLLRLWLLPLLLLTVTQYVSAQCTAPTITSAPAQGDTVVTYLGDNYCTKDYTFVFYATGTSSIIYEVTMTGATNATGGTGIGIFHYSQYQKGVTKLVLKAVNNCGSDTRTFYMNVVDTFAPKIYGPNSYTLTLNNNSGCSLSASGVLANYYFDDNCGTVSRSISPSTINIGTANYTVSGIDASGNVGTKTVSVTLLAPEIDVLNNSVSIADNDTIPSTSDGTDFGTVYPYPSYTKSYQFKNTGTDTLYVSGASLTNQTNGGGFSVVYSSFPQKIAPGKTGGVTIRLDPSISLGNPTADLIIQNNDCDESTYNFRLSANVVCPNVSLTVPTDTVYKSTNSGECKANYIVSTNVSAGGSLAIDYFQYVLSGATNASFNSLYNFNGYFNIGVTKVQVRAYNICGSYAEKTFYVKVSDNIAPYIYLSAATLNVGSGCTASTNSLKTDYIHDACGVASVTNDAPSTLALGTWTVKWTATDVHGNTSTANQTVTVVDNIKPTITAPGNLIENTDNSSCSATNISLGTPTTADNCSVDSVWNDAPASFPKGSTTVTWTVRDASGNTDTATQTVTVIDKQRPNISGPSVITLSMSSGCTMSSSSLLNYYNYSDNCGVISYKSVSPSQLAIGTNYCLVRARDASGNERQYAVTVTVTAPEIQVQYGNTVITDGDLTISTTDGTDWGQLSPNQFYYKTYTVKNTSNVALDVSSLSLSTVSGGGGFSINTNPFPATIAAGQSMDFKVRFFSTNTTISGNTTADIKINNADCDEAEYNFRIGAYQICPPVSLNALPDTVNRNTDAGTCHSNYTFSVIAGSQSPISYYKYILTGATTIDASSGSRSFTYNYNVGTTNVRVYAINRCGNSTYKDFTVVVTNNQTPVVTAPADITVNADSGVCWATVTNFGTPTTSGICYVDTIWSDAMSSYQVGPSTIAWTVKDNNNNTYTATQKITVVDNQPPTITPPADITVNADNGSCGALVTLGIPTTSDNCGVASVSNNAPGSFPVGTTSVTWTVKDVNGNTTTATQKVTVIDNQKPDIFAPEDIFQYADSGVCYKMINGLGAETTGDNCGILSVTHNGSGTYPVGTTTVTWTVTDIHGNTNTATQNVTIADNQAPNLTLPPDLIVDADNGSCYATNVDLGISFASDNCGLDSVWNNAPASFPVGNTTVTWTAKDIHGNIKTDIQNITVMDNQNPTITPPATVTVNADNGSCAATNVALGIPSTSDNCGVDSVWNNAPASFPVGNTTVTWTVLDIHGNSSTANQTVTVVDNQNPDITAPIDVTTNADFGQCYATNVALDVPTTGDNCGILSVNNNAPSSFPVGTTTVTWTVTDIHGNTNTATQTVTVIDNQNPTITSPANVTVNTDNGICGATNVALGTPITADNCGVDSVWNNAPALLPVGNTTITWTVKDIHGNTSIATSTVTVIDNENPTIVCPSDLTVNADNGQCAATNVSLGAPTTSDNCAVDSVWNNAPSSYSVGTTTVTWTVTDIHGNTATCTQNVIVIDNQNPTIAAPAAVSVNADNGTCAATNVALGSPTTADNCGVDSVWNNAPTTYSVGTTTVIWTVTDIHGNNSTTTQAVTVVDNQAPTVVCKNHTVTLSGGTTTISASDIDNGSTDNCGIETMSLSKSTFTCADAGENQVILTVYDIHGNSASCTATVTVPAAPSVSITTTPANNTYTGGNPNQIFLGYGSQSATISANTNGGNTFNYSWSPATDLSCNNCQSPVFTPTSAGNYTYTLTATNEGGCSATSTVSFCVLDVQEYKNNGSLSGKIYVCIPKNNGQQTKAVQPNKVAGHLQVGARLGKCEESCGSAAKSGNNNVVQNEGEEDNSLTEMSIGNMKLYPNPNTGTFKIELPEAVKEGMVIVRDMMGKEVKRLSFYTAQNMTFSIPEVADGIYMLEVLNNDRVYKTRVVIRR